LSKTALMILKTPPFAWMGERLRGRNLLKIPARFL
jgi:hypothetical protein